MTIEAISPEVIARAQSGDSEVIGELYERYNLGLFRYLYYRLGDKHTAEDLTSEVFVRMIRALRGYRSQNVSFDAWLFQIARNLAVDHLRKMNVRNHVTLEEEMIAETDDVDGTVERKLTSDKLVSALNRLSDEQRDVLILRFVNGMRIEQVAQTLHKSVDSIKGLQRRGLLALREILTDWEVNYV
ncbi:MAG TPA: sigma-70 family RNA polymerase sigma factor [Anaerolineales bacterium]|nr:sigma-70 family RNA polymerase sigma factor [Anaerolineales bacterium]